MSDRPIRDPGRTIGTSAASGPPPCIPSEVDVLDPAVVDSLRRLGARSGRDVLGELTALFLSTADAQVGAAGELLARADLPELARIAHALKGSGSVIGARRVSAAAANLEHTCGRPDRSVAGGSVAEAAEALAAFTDELEAFRHAVAGLGLAP